MLLDKDFPPDERVERAALKLIEQGHDLLLVCFTLNSDKPSDENIKGITVKRIPISSRLYKLSAMAYSIPTYHSKISKLAHPVLEEFSPDVLHIHDMVVAGAFIGKVSWKTVLDLHEDRPAIMKYYGGYQKMPQKLLVNFSAWEKAQAKLVDKADRVIVVTDQAADPWREMHSDKVFVVPNTLSRNNIPPVGADSGKWSEETFRIVYFGDTGLRRGTGFAIEAMKELANENPKIHLDIIGSSGEDEELRKLILDLDVGEYVTMHGYRSLDYFYEIASKAHVGICPLDRNRHHDTTYANKLFQYMSLGLPLVVSDCPAQEQLVRNINCGLVFKSRSSDQYIQRINELNTDRHNARKLGSNGSEAVKGEWSWEKKSEQLLELYASF